MFNMFYKGTYIYCDLFHITAWILIYNYIFILQVCIKSHDLTLLHTYFALFTPISLKALSHRHNASRECRARRDAESIRKYGIWFQEL